MDALQHQNDAINSTKTTTGEYTMRNNLFLLSQNRVQQPSKVQDSRPLLPTLEHSPRTGSTIGIVPPDMTEPADVLDRSTSAMLTEVTKRSVISKIETIFVSIADGIMQGDEKLVLPVMSRASRSAESFTRGKDPVQRSLAMTNSAAIKSRGVCFPGSNVQECWRFAVIVRILELMHEALKSGAITTKRDIFYKDPGLFQKQCIVDRYVDDIAFSFRVQRLHLNVVASAKGLVVGVFNIRCKDGSLIDYSTETEGTIVPFEKEVWMVDLSLVKWILVVEKEAIFRSLATSGFWHRASAGKGIIVTGKGYPDLSTRAFLRMLAEQGLPSGSKQPPIYGLMDFDPDGISILSTYKHGSLALAHENFHLTIPRICWLGLSSRDLPSTYDVDDNEARLGLTGRDRRMAVRMLEKDVFAEVEGKLQWRRELQVMLLLNTKMEIEILSSKYGGLEAWIDAEVGTRQMLD
ncbi:MAG: hypothetical protein M1827_000125 [Pycnora praestabilis]|nr:MAG: hypothetical protein M1827_000125 [Pycnora praestabilis]